MVLKKDKEKGSKEELSEEELEDMMIKACKEQIRSDYRRSLGSEHTRRCKDLSLKKGSSEE